MTARGMSGARASNKCGGFPGASPTARFLVILWPARGLPWLGLLVAWNWMGFRISRDCRMLVGCSRWRESEGY